jgi:hypothetical protein
MFHFIKSQFAHYYYTYACCWPLGHHRTFKPIANWFLFSFCHVFEIINVIKLILQCRAATQMLSILYPNIAELADVWVYYMKSFQMLAKEIMACISLKLGTSAFLFWADSLFLLIKVSPVFLLGFCIFHLFLTWDLPAALICVLVEWNDILLGGHFLCEPSLAR